VVSLAERYTRLASRPNRGLRILVAEDNETNRMVLQGILERIGHHPVLAEDGEVALDLLGQDAEPFDLMILDKNMPGRSGLDVFKAHRFMTRSPIPAILLTADATPDALAESSEAGVDAYLTKPVDTLKLLETIARLADRGGQPQAAVATGQRGAEPRGQSVALVDEEKLRSLLQLGGGSGFFDDLVGVFLQDGERALDAIAQALAERDYPALRAALHALRGSASELGASRIVALCVELRALKPFELASDRADGLLAELRHAHQATAEALGAFPRTPVSAGSAALVEGPWARPGGDR
jgi:two-component system sensor histidine kinase RpfC